MQCDFFLLKILKFSTIKREEYSLNILIIEISLSMSSKQFYFCVSVQIMYKLFSLLNTITNINFKTFEEYLRELERAQTDRQTNRMHKRFSTFLKNVNNV